jgi:23S rRNA (adenine2030-N6)-methyltransferase
LNYRHAFHAGGFADVIKHAVLVRVLLHLAKKDAPFRVIETHAGAGRYDLSGAQAARTGEWREGIGRLMERPLTGAAGELIAAYVAVVRGLNASGRLAVYPGSPLITQALLRPQDRMTFCELHPAERAALAANLGRDGRAKVVEVDGWRALKAFLPPKERRGLVLIDPPFESDREFANIESGLGEAHNRWATGSYLIWYPIKDAHETEAFARRLARMRMAKVLRLEASVDARRAGGRLAGCGLIAVNPSWPLEKEAGVLFAQLVKVLARKGSGNYRIDWLSKGR